MIYFLVVLYVAIYVLGVIGMGALSISIAKGKKLEPDKRETVAFAITWPFQVIKSLF